MWRNTRLIFSKELKDTLRDRRTLFIMILLPILLYPVLIIAITQIVAAQTISLRKQVYKIKVWNAPEAPRLKKLLQDFADGKQNPDPDPDRKTPASPQPPATRLEIIWEDNPDLLTIPREYDLPLEDNAGKTIPSNRGNKAPAMKMRVTPVEQINNTIEKARLLVSEGIDRGEFYAGLVVPPDFEATLDNGGNQYLLIIYSSTNERSKEAGARLKKFAQEWYIDPLERDRQKKILVRAGLTENDRRYFRPVVMEKRDLSSTGDQIRYFMSMVLPMMLITMVLTGAFYPAIDLSAGEKERGTMETLLVSPASRLEIVLGKYLTVCVIALVTALLNILSLGFTFLFLAATIVPPGAMGAPGAEQGGAVVGLGAVASMFVVMLPLAALFSAMTLAISSFARSFKEGQNYLTPFLVLVTLPAMASMIPAVSLSTATCFIPVFNTSLLFKSLLMQKAVPMHVVLVFGANALYAAFAIRWTVRLFQREEILFRSMDEVSWRFWKSRPKPGGLPTSSQALIVFFLALTLQITVGQYMQSRDILVGLPVTLIGIMGGGALIFALWGRFDARRTFRFVLPRAGDIVSALALALCAVFVAREIVFLQTQISPSITESIRGLERDLMRKMAPLFAHPAVAIFYIAVLPGIFEELFFRGPLLSGLEQGRSLWQAALICGILFGIMHLAFAKIIPTAVIGVMLAFFVLRTGSIFPAMLMHITYNAINILPVFAPPELQAPLDGALTILSHWMALPCLLAAVFLLWQLRKRPAADSD